MLRCSSACYYCESTDNMAFLACTDMGMIKGLWMHLLGGCLCACSTLNVERDEEKN